MHIVFSALAYSFPVDAISDMILIRGYGDNAGALVTALLTLQAYITDEHREEAKQWLENKRTV